MARCLKDNQPYYRRQTKQSIHQQRRTFIDRRKQNPCHMDGRHQDQWTSRRSTHRICCRIQCPLVQCIDVCHDHFEEQGKSPERIYKWKETAESLKTAFVETFLNDYGYLYDYVDGNYMDLSVRPSMLIAVGCDFSPLDKSQRKRCLTS